MLEVQAVGTCVSKHSPDARLAERLEVAFAVDMTTTWVSAGTDASNEWQLCGLDGLRTEREQKGLGKAGSAQTLTPGACLAFFRSGKVCMVNKP